VKSIIST